MTRVETQRQHTTDWLSAEGEATTLYSFSSTWGKQGEISSVTYKSQGVISADWQPYKPDKNREETGDVIKADYVLYCEYALTIEPNYKVKRNVDNTEYEVVAIKDYPDHKEVYVLTIKGARYAK